ncbi:hypothetical protein IMZ31_04920 [Pontibacillus sp. ALD_SL1]|uniref:hypothetical protein n=1 Tax=Pontibacillus sp. ALD_SL1 TaxID=2777185 RepID=UPI001A9662AB|nr:hypothetical protein [Pontibacillus sp. ALD_SL1]QST00916.1 hypothetical protein IMZ31_04920 [Pontibacillus sp. ALD_SL1]
MLRKVNMVLPAMVLGLCLYHFIISPIDWPIEITFSLIALMNFFLGLEEFRDRKKLRGGIYFFTSLVLVTGVIVDVVRETM